jgi:hypothetical protein
MTDITPRQQASFAGRIGLTRADITPPVGIYARSWGAARHDVAESIHRPLMLSVMTLSAEQGTAPLVLVDADLGWWRPLDRFLKFRDRLLTELSLDASRLIFAVAHTHAAAPLMAPDPALPGSELLGPWQEEIFQASVRTIRAALDNTFEGTLDWHAGHCNLASNRDLPDPDKSKQRFLCGYNPAVEADDTLLVGRVSDRAGALRGVLVNYACHPTSLAWDNRAISPDYVGAMRATIEESTGAPGLFLLGACGELSPRYQYVADTEVADRHGRQLAHAALAALYDMEPPGTQLRYAGAVESGAPLAVWRHQPRELSSDLRAVVGTAELDLKDWPTADELEQQRVATGDRALEERLRRKRDIRRTLGDGETFTLPVYAWRLGEAVLVGCCCEAYSALQIELRRRFPQRTVLCMNLINGTLGYLPPADLYDTDIYQVWQTPFDCGGLERVIETMTAAIDELFR